MIKMLNNNISATDVINEIKIILNKDTYDTTEELSKCIMNKLIEIENDISNNSINLGQLSSMTHCTNCGFTIYIFPNQSKVVCEHCNTINNLII